MASTNPTESGSSGLTGFILGAALITGAAFWKSRRPRKSEKIVSGTSVEKADTLGRRASVHSSIADIDKREVSKTVKECVANRQELEGIRKKIRSDLQQKVPVSKITHDSCEKMNAFLTRLYKEAEDKIFKETGRRPPCDYCVGELGSMARKESGPYPDYDNFIVVDYKFSDENADEADYEVRNYFTKLSQYVSDRIVRLGEETGFRLCIGNLNAPYQEYESRYSADRELNLRGRQELLGSIYGPIPENLSDFVDSAPICGKESLYKKYMDLAFSDKSQKSTIAMKNIKQNVDGINKNKESPINTQKLPEAILLNIKSDLYRFPQATITALALFYDINEKNTAKRIELLAEKGVFTKTFAAKLITAVEHLIRFRLQVQSVYGEELEFVSTSSYEVFKKADEERRVRLGVLEHEIRSVEARIGMPLESRMKIIGARLKEMDGLIAKKISINNIEQERLKKELDELERMKGGRDCLNDLLKIAGHQYDETGSSKPDVFSQRDRDILEKEVLPVLHELYLMAEKSITGSSFNPAAFNPKP